MAEGDLIQQSAIPVREAPGGGAQQASISDDNRHSREETARLQGTYQRVINDGRDDVIGAAP
jgi:hypothetical protein